MDDVFSIFQKKKRASTTRAADSRAKNIFPVNKKSRRKSHNEDGTEKYYAETPTGRGKKNVTESKDIENVITVDFPALPFKNPEDCISFYYIQYLRNQLIYGNKNIQINETMKTVAESLLEKIENDIYELEYDPDPIEKLGNQAKIVVFKCIYDRYFPIYSTFLTFSESIPLPNNLYEYVLNDGVYIRSKKNEDFNCRENIHNIYSYLDNVDVGQNDLSINSENIFINAVDISKPTIVNKNIINVDIDIEYLPLKFNSSYCCNSLQYAKFFLNDSINMSIYERALGELIVVKALTHLPSIPIKYIEGFDIPQVEAGTRFWVPIYIAIALSSYSYVEVEFPFWFYIKNFMNIKDEEYKKPELFELPSPYFFEICYMFIDKRVFAKSNPIETVGQKSLFKYIAKVAGYIEDIKHCRIDKIIGFLEEQNVHTSHIYIPNLQYSETYLVNLTLYGFWKYDAKNGLKYNSLDLTSYLLEPFMQEEQNTDDHNLLEDL